MVRLFGSMQFLRPVYKPHSVRPHKAAWMIISLGDLLPARSSSLPGIQQQRAAPGTENRALSLLDLAPSGGYLAVVLLPAPVVSYTTISPLPLARRFVSVARSGRLLHPGGYPALCSLECGLSSKRHKAAPRSSNQPEKHIIPYREPVVKSPPFLHFRLY